MFARIVQAARRDLSRRRRLGSEGLDRFLARIIHESIRRLIRWYLGTVSLQGCGGTLEGSYYSHCRRDLQTAEDPADLACHQSRCGTARLLQARRRRSRPKSEAWHQTPPTADH
jgi:hypothetical protein